jgi:predicted metal-dependent phosphoesterase TrpH
LLKADFHIHSQYSKDSSSTLEQIILACQKKGINCIAIADHGAIEGALKMKQIAPFQVVVAEEVLTTRGEIMGMFLKELVPSGLSMEKSIRLIKDQGGLLCTPHPFDKFRGSALDARTMNEIAGQIDVVEIFNARNPLLRSSRQAKQFAREHNLPGSAGSDAHAPYEIGNAYLEIPEFNGRDDFLQALFQAKIFGRRASPFSHFSSAWSRLKKAF